MKMRKVVIASFLALFLMFPLSGLSAQSGTEKEVVISLQQGQGFLQKFEAIPCNRDNFSIAANASGYNTPYAMHHMPANTPILAINVKDCQAAATPLVAYETQLLLEADGLYARAQNEAAERALNATLQDKVNGLEEKVSEANGQIKMQDELLVAVGKKLATSEAQKSELETTAYRKAIAAWISIGTVFALGVLLLLLWRKSSARATNLQEQLRTSQSISKSQSDQLEEARKQLKKAKDDEDKLLEKVFALTESLANSVPIKVTEKNQDGTEEVHFELDGSRREKGTVEYFCHGCGKSGFEADLLPDPKDPTKSRFHRLAKHARKEHFTEREPVVTAMVVEPGAHPRRVLELPKELQNVAIPRGAGDMDL